MLYQSHEEFLKEEIARDPGLRKAMLLESIRRLLNGDVRTGKGLLRKYIRTASGQKFCKRDTGNNEF